MLIWFHSVSVREWGRWSITKRKTQGKTGRAIWVTEPLRSQVSCHLTIIPSVHPEAQNTFMSVPSRKVYIGNTMTCKSGSFKVMWNKSCPSFPWFQNGYNYVCLPLRRNWPAIGIALLSLMKRYSLNLVPHRSWAHCLHVKQGPGGYSWNGTSRDAWKHILVLQGEEIWQEIYLVILACTHRKTAVDLTQCGVLSRKPHLMLDTLPTCLHAINCLLRQDMGTAEKSKLCENI